MESDMPKGVDARDKAGRSAWLLLAYATVLVAVASGHLAWLLWRYVPLHAAIFAGMGINLPGSTVLVVRTSTWFVRLLPFLVLLLVPISGMLVTTLLIAATNARRAASLVKGVATVGLLVALVEAVACAGIVHAVHAAYSVGATDAKFQEGLRAFEAYRRQQQSPAAPP